MELRVLNNTQKKETMDLLKFYKYIYLCNKCGSIYGSDSHEKGVLCPCCENKLRGRKK